MDKNTIAGQIEAEVMLSGYPPKDWRIGITQNLNDRYECWHNPASFRFWEADSLGDAQEIEALFLDPNLKEKKMQGGVGGDLAPGKKAYVYIFIARETGDEAAMIDRLAR